MYFVSAIERKKMKPEKRLDIYFPNLTHRCQYKYIPMYIYIAEKLNLIKLFRNLKKTFLFFECR